MDGTLLNKASVLSATTTNMLNDVIAQGALFTVATARTPATVVGLMKDVRATLPFIVMAGCAMWDNAKQEYSSARIIPNDTIERIIEVFEKHDNNPFVYYKNGNSIMVNHVEEMTKDELDFIEPRIMGSLKRLQTVKSLRPDSSYDGVMLLFSMGNFNELRAIANEIDELGIECTYNCYHDIFDDSKGFIDLYVKGTTKAAAIKSLANEVGAERIVVFGDNLNDIPMMKVADHSVAVSNAFDEVKQYADEIIGSNEADSVAKWILNDFRQ